MPNEGLSRRHLSHPSGDGFGPRCGEDVWAADVSLFVCLGASVGCVCLCLRVLLTVFV